MGRFANRYPAGNDGAGRDMHVVVDTHIVIYNCPCIDDRVHPIFAPDCTTAPAIICAPSPTTVSTATIAEGWMTAANEKLRLKNRLKTSRRVDATSTPPTAFTRTTPFGPRPSVRHRCRHIRGPTALSRAMLVFLDIGSRGVRSSRMRRQELTHGLRHPE